MFGVRGYTATDAEGNTREVSGAEMRQENRELRRQMAEAERQRLTDPYDQHSLALLQDYDAIASGQKQTLAEMEARRLGQQMAAGVFGASKLRRGVSGAGTFSQAAQAAADVRKQGLAEAEAIGQQQRQQAAQDALRFRAGKESERRQLTMGYEQMLEQRRQADEQAQAQLTGSFFQTAASIAISWFTKGMA
tara:strand:+ start:74 stop:649 length:576 start_codon:yes stop_codon:yes gene_type:complete